MNPLTHGVLMTAQDDLAHCLRAWKETLDAFGIEKDPKMDEVQIFRMIQAHGAAQTHLALLGARFEAKTQSFDPGNYVSVRRVAKPDVFDKLVNLGAKEVTRRERAASQARSVEATKAVLTSEGETAAEEYTQNPERVRSILSGIMRKLT